MALRRRGSQKTYPLVILILIEKTAASVLQESVSIWRSGYFVEERRFRGRKVFGGFRVKYLEKILFGGIFMERTFGGISVWEKRFWSIASKEPR